MKLFLDTVDSDEIKRYQYYGLVDGITTNPTLMSKNSKGFIELASELCELVDGDVSLEVGSTEYENMVGEGEKISSIAKNAVIKLPMTFDGIKACRYFTDKGIKVNMTLCFTTMQALIAARSGAAYISPFIGRLDDIGENGLDLIADIREIYNHYNISTKILAASIRNLEHLEGAALCGADFVTIPPKLMDQIISHELTDKGLEIFKSDWQQSGKVI